MTRHRVPLTPLGKIMSACLGILLGWTLTLTFASLVHGETRIRCFEDPGPCRGLGCLPVDGPTAWASGPRCLPPAPGCMYQFPTQRLGQARTGYVSVYAKLCAVFVDGQYKGELVRP